MNRLEKYKLLAFLCAVAMLCAAGCTTVNINNTNNSPNDSTTTTSSIASSTTTTTTTTPPSTVTTTTTQKPSTTTTYEKGDDPIPEKYNDTVLSKTADQGEDYLKDIVFIGDSRTVGYQYYGVLADGKDTVQVWANTGFQLTKWSSAKFTFPDDGSQKTIQQAIELKKPKIVIIELGLNSVSYLSESKFKTAYSGLIQMIQQTSPETKIICNSMYCVCRSYAKPDVINNTKIYTSNRWLMEVAYQNGVKYLNTVSVLRDAEGYLPESYQSGDGLHLKGSTYHIILDYIRTHAYL